MGLVYAQPSSLWIGKVNDFKTNTTMDLPPNLSLSKGNPLLGFLGPTVNEPRITKGDKIR